MQEVAAVAFSNPVFGDEHRQRCSDLRLDRIARHGRVQHGGDVAGVELHARNLGAERDHSHDLRLEAVLAVGGCDLVDLVTPGGRDDVFQQDVGTIERNERANVVVFQADAVVADELLGVTNERAVRSAHRLRRPALGTAGRHRVDQHVELIRHEGVEANEVLVGEWLVSLRLQRHRCRKLVAVRVEHLADSLCALGGLVEYAFAGDLVDVRRQQIHPDREPVLRLRELGLLSFEAVDDVGQFLLRRSH